MTTSKILKDWLGTFWRILISPSPKTFAEEAEKATDKFASSVGWAAFIALYSYLFFSLAAGSAASPSLLIIALLVFPLVVVLIPSATHFVLQRVFHRKQYLYDKVLYIYAAILVLFQLIINPTLLLPMNVSTVLSYLLLAYQFILLVIAIKAIAEIEYWQAAVTILISVVVGVLVLVCAFPIIASLMGSVTRVLR